SFFLVFLPVVKEKVVEKPPSGCAFAVPPQQFGDKKAKVCDVDAMVEPGVTVVLYVIAHFLHLRMFQQRTNMLVKLGDRVGTIFPKPVQKGKSHESNHPLSENVAAAVFG
ncbi:MAG TPA: hypothetical protein GX499_10380, partial [Clostridiales bacterium]|nr:hypothetical protein [Clostridiales bacterium]